MHCFITSHCSCHVFLLVHHELGEKGPCLQQWGQVVFLQLCGIRLWTSHQLSASCDSHPAASPRLSNQLLNKQKKYTMQILNASKKTCWVFWLITPIFLLAFSSISQHASNVGLFQAFLGIYERQGVRGFYSGMGTSFVRAVPCALLNYTLTTKLETVLSQWTIPLMYSKSIEL